VLENVQSAATGADQPEAHTVIGAQDTRRQKNRRAGKGGRTSAQVMDKSSTIQHGCNSLCLN
jgi:hypothetical protein